MAEKRPGVVNTNYNETKRLVLTAMFMAIGMVLPFLTGQIPQIGRMLLPMHIPVFLCAFICGTKHSTVLGLTLPLLRSVCFGMPVFYPDALSMAAELAAYGLVTGLLYRLTGRGGLKSIYPSLLGGMIVGRGVWGLVRMLLLGFGEDRFTAGMFLAGALTGAIPGILLQLVLVPATVTATRIYGNKKGGRTE